MYSYKVAKTKNERQKVFSLIKRVYAAQGYISDGNDDSFQKYLLLPQTKVFTAFVNEKLFGTISVIPDSKIGLPMDVLYKKELSAFRLPGRKIAEISQYAVDHQILKTEDAGFNSIKQLTVSRPLLALVFHYGLYALIDNYCITINPKHDQFYKSLGFTELGNLKYYPSVNNAPALARVFDRQNFKQEESSGFLGELLKDKPDYNIFK